MGPLVSLDLLEYQHVDGTWIGALKLHQAVLTSGQSHSWESSLEAMGR